MNTDQYTFYLNITHNGTQVIDTSITARAETPEIARAKRVIQRLLNQYTPKPAPEPPDPEPEAPGEGQPVQVAAREWTGAKGLLHLGCRACGSRFGTFLREPQEKAFCRCGEPVDLTGPLARFAFTCPACGKSGYGRTNLEDAEITVRCRCGEDVVMEWVPEAKEYRN